MIERDYSRIAYDPKDSDRSRRVFGQNVLSLRKSQGISLNALSLKIGFNASYISRIENGAISASGKFVEALADELGASRFDLAIMSGLLTVDFSKMTDFHLAALREIVDKGALSLQD